jgi:DNA-binding NarL/FixJ family response regulator
VGIGYRSLCSGLRIEDSQGMSSSSDAGSLTRVLVVDADARTRESLTGLLEIGRRVAVVGSAGDPARALELATALEPDVVVVDPRLPEVALGRAFIARLRELRPGCRVLVMNSSAAPSEGSAPLDADAFVRKTFRVHELVDAVLACGRSPATS